MFLNTLLKNRLQLFLLLNLGGWLGYGITSYLASRFWGEEWGLPCYRFTSAFAGFLVSLLLRLIYKRVWEKPLWQQVTVVVLGSYLAAALMALLGNHALAFFYPEVYQVNNLMHQFKGIVTLFYMFICWSGLYFGFKFYEGMQLATQRALRANALAHQAQLKMLRYQLNPHFLFNTLNAISTLILEKNNTIANDMVARLSNFLRYSLDNDPMHKTTLAQEVTALKLYLDIEKVRFEERLRLSFELEEAALDGLIPSLLLQPLVENAIKHAIAQSEQGGSITIRARVFARELLLEICDDGPGMAELDGGAKAPSDGKGCGVGMRNTRERLQELYGEAHSFQISNLQPQGLQICIRIPYQTQSKTKSKSETSVDYGQTA